MKYFDETDGTYKEGVTHYYDSASGQFVEAASVRVWDASVSDWVIVWEPYNWLSLNSDNEADSPSGWSGVNFYIDSAATGVRVRISENVGANAAWPSTAVLMQGAGGTVVDTLDISSLGPGDEIELFDPNGMTASDYAVLLHNDNSNYGRGRYYEVDQYPYTNADLEVFRGIYSEGGSVTQNVRYNFDRIAAVYS